MLRNLTLYYQNVRGIRTKAEVFASSVIGRRFDIVCLTEMWLCDGIDISDYFGSDYSFFVGTENTQVVT